MVAKTVAVAQQQHGFVLERVGAHAAVLGQRVVARYGGKKRLVVEGRNRQPRIGKRLGQDGAINLAGAKHLQQFDGEVLLQHERHLRRAGDHLAHQVGQQVGRDGVDHAQLQGAGQRVFAALGDVFDIGGLLQHALRLAHDFLAQRRNRYLVGAAFKQFDVQLFFELFYCH